MFRLMAHNIDKIYKNGNWKIWNERDPTNITKNNAKSLIQF